MPLLLVVMARAPLQALSRAVRAHSGCCSCCCCCVLCTRLPRLTLRLHALGSHVVEDAKPALRQPASHGAQRIHDLHRCSAAQRSACMFQH